MAGNRVVEKDFQLQAEWSPLQADLLNALLDKLVTLQVQTRSGSYTGQGSGADKRVDMDPLLTPPLLVFVEDTTTQGVTTVMSISAGGTLVSWDKTGFVVRGASTLNIAGRLYQYLVVTFI